MTGAAAKELPDILKPLHDPVTGPYIRESLGQSLSSIGFSPEFIDALLQELPCIDIADFRRRHGDEANQVHGVGFFQNIVPTYFEAHVIPYIPTVAKIMDIGCGTGILAHRLSRSGRFKHVIGIDLLRYAEWEIFSDKKACFHVVPENQFSDFLKAESPGAVVLTWVMHHMYRDEQVRYLATLHETLHKGAHVVLLEDAYAVEQPAEEGAARAKAFHALTAEQKQDVMALFDWVANRVLLGRDKVKMPYTYRTVEDWLAVAESAGFTVTQKRYIGFPERRDINTPQSLLVLTV